MKIVIIRRRSKEILSKSYPKKRRDDHNYRIIEEGAVVAIYIASKYRLWTASLKKKNPVSEIIAIFLRFDRNARIEMKLREKHMGPIGRKQIEFNP